MSIAMPVTLPRIQWTPLMLTGGISVALLAWLAIDSPRMAALLVVGLLLGVTLAHASFGFSAAFRRLIQFGDTRSISAQCVMLAAATLLFAPLLAAGEIFGWPVAGAVAPVGVSMMLGALVFGIGMQLAGACGSGTLFALGSGSPRMLIVLLICCAGGFAASLQFGFWLALPELEAISIGEQLGWLPAGLLQAGLLFAAAGYLYERDAALSSIAYRFWSGPWPLFAGALSLAILNFLTLMLAGHPWTIIWAFTLWAAKFARMTGWDSSASDFWSGAFQQAALGAPLLADVTSVMDIGLICGAALAAAPGGRFRGSWQIPLRSLAAALIGGLAMGYGARLSYGCNIGAFFSGIASTSLHGWVWIVWALGGSWVGFRLRPVFALDHGKK